MEGLLPQTETAPIDKEQARMMIAEIRQRVAIMGANDSEFWNLDLICDKMEKGESTPEEAVTEANGVLSSKQDYH